MTIKKPLVVVTRRLPDLVETRMRELFDARLNVDDKPMSESDIAEAMREADVLVPTITDQISAGMIAQAGESMKLIANFGNGVDHIDVTSALRRGITVTNTPGVLTEDTADMTMALILSTPRASRKARGSFPRAANGRAHWSPTWMLGRGITGKRLGILSMGRIGQALAKARRASACRSTITTAADWRSADRGGAGGDLLGSARPDAGAGMDIVSAQLPRTTPATYHLLSARRLKLSQARRGRSSSTPRAAK